MTTRQGRAGGTVKSKGKARRGLQALARETKSRTKTSSAGTVASLVTTRRTVDRSGHRTCGGQERKGKGKVQGDELADGWWKAADWRQIGRVQDSG